MIRPDCRYIDQDMVGDNLYAILRGVSDRTIARVRENNGS